MVDGSRQRFFPFVRGKKIKNAFGFWPAPFAITFYFLATLNLIYCPLQQLHQLQQCCKYCTFGPNTELYPKIIQQTSTKSKLRINCIVHGFTMPYSTVRTTFPWFFKRDVLKLQVFPRFWFFLKFHDFSRSGKCFFHFPDFAGRWESWYLSCSRGIMHLVAPVCVFVCLSICPSSPVINDLKCFSVCL